MAYWKMGVAAFIPNNGFRWGTRCGAQLTAAITTGTSLSYDNATVDGDSSPYSNGLIKLIRVGDKVLIGPSTAVGYEGASEYVIVTSVTSSTINFSAQTNFQYANNDYISAIGSNLAGGWLSDTSSPVSVLGGITRHSQHALTTLDGVGTRYSQQLVSSESSLRYIRVELNRDDFLSNIPFRIGCYYQYYASPADSGQIEARLNANSSSFIDETITSSNVVTWTEYNSAAETAPASVGDLFYLHLGVDGVSSGTGYGNFTGVYAEHGAGTTGESSGAYTFPEYCDLNSRKFKFIRGASNYRTINNSVKTNNFTGLSDGGKKTLVSASFSDVPSTFRDNLEVLMDWQLRGKYLVLHHDIPNAPPNIQGIMTIRDTSLKNWSSDLCSFAISFEEA
jgi:hypothetical protein